MKKLKDLEVGDYYWRIYFYSGVGVDEIIASTAYVNQSGALILYDEDNTEVIYAPGTWQQVRRVIIEEKDNVGS